VRGNTLVLLRGGGTENKKYIGHGIRKYPLVLLVKVVCSRKASQGKTGNEEGSVMGSGLFGWGGGKKLSIRAEFGG